MAELRLQVHLARAGLLSRRHAEQAIDDGRVTVNGEVVREQGTKIDPSRDDVRLDGQRVGAPEPAATIMLFKPDGVVSTLDDPRGRPTVADYVKDEPYRFVPVGRLDYHTEGLLLLSTDGELTHRLLHPRFHVPKTYRVRVKGTVTDKALDRLREGIELDDGPTRPAIAELVEAEDRTTWLELVVTEGRNHLVRRMCDAVGHEARRVVRTEMGTLFVGDLKPGQYRYLSPPELHALYRSAELDPPPMPPRFDEVGTAVQGTPQRHKGAIPGVHEPKEGAEGRRRIAPKGRAQPLAAPVDDFDIPELRKRLKPKIAPERPDGIPENRRPGYPDTRIWRSERTKTTGRSRDGEADNERVVRVRAERRRPRDDEGEASPGERRAAPSGRGAADRRAGPRRSERDSGFPRTEGRSGPRRTEGHYGPRRTEGRSGPRRSEGGFGARSTDARRSERSSDPRRSDPRRSDDRRSESRRSDPRRSDDRRSDRRTDAPPGPRSRSDRPRRDGYEPPRRRTSPDAQAGRDGAPDRRSGAPRGRTPSPRTPRGRSAPRRGDGPRSGGRPRSGDGPRRGGGPRRR